MAFVTSETVSSLAVPLLSSELSLAWTVSQVPSTDFAPYAGGSTIIRVPGTRTGKVQTAGATLDSDAIVETEVTFSVKHIYDNAPLTPHDLSLNVVDFTRQVVRPQVRSVAAGAEKELATVMNNLTADVTGAAGNLDQEIANAVATLDEAEVPFEGRYLAVSPQAAAVLTSGAALNLTDFDGEVASEALRRGIVGEYRGMIVVKSARLTGTKLYAYHESAFAFATMRPAEILGAVDAASYSEEGVQVRHAYMVDSTTATTKSLMSTFCGAALVDADRVVVIDASA